MSHSKVVSSNIATVEYQYDLGKSNGKVAYIMRWKDNSKDKGQIFLDRGETIQQFKNNGFEIEILN